MGNSPIAEVFVMWYEELAGRCFEEGQTILGCGERLVPLDDPGNRLHARNFCRPRSSVRSLGEESGGTRLDTRMGFFLTSPKSKLSTD